MTESNLIERSTIRDLVENWAVWRDAGDWDRFKTVWHQDGWMCATWFQGFAPDFIRVSKEGWEKGVSILHFLGGTSIDLDGDRAIAQTKMTISQRAAVHNVVSMSSVRDASTTFWKSVRALGVLFCGNRFMRRTGWTRSIRI